MEPERQLLVRELYQNLQRQFKHQPVDTHEIADHLFGSVLIALDWGWVRGDPVAFRASADQWAMNVAMDYKAWRDRPPSPKPPPRPAKPISPQIEHLVDTVAEWQHRRRYGVKEWPGKQQTQPSTSVVTRIRKLIALATKNPNQHEAASAAARAEMMLKEHQITRSQISCDDARYVKQKFHLGGNRTSIQWRTSLLGILAEAHRCTAFRYSRSHHACVFGRPSDIEVVRYFHASLAREVERLIRAQQFWDTDRRSYAFGIIRGIRTTLLGQVDDPPPVERAKRRPSPQPFSSRAFEQGKRDGAAISMTTAIEEKPS